MRKHLTPANIRAQAHVDAIYLSHRVRLKDLPKTKEPSRQVKRAQDRAFIKQATRQPQRFKPATYVPQIPKMWGFKRIVIHPDQIAYHFTKGWRFGRAA